MKRATLADLDQLVELMVEFYAESRYPLDLARAADSFRALLRDERLGQAWLIEAKGSAVGYLVVTLGYSMEYGGIDAFIDELFVQPAFRGMGLGSGALREARAFCQERGVRAIHLEAERSNVGAQELYARAGFVDNDRQLLTLRL